MRICYLALELASATAGGIGSYVHTMANAMVARGHDVTAVGPSIRAPKDALYEAVSVPVRYSHETRRLDIAHGLAAHLEGLPPKQSFDIVEVTDWGMEGACFGTASPWCTVLRMHTPNSMVTELNGFSRWLDAAAVDRAEPLYFGTARHLSSPSHAMADQFTCRWGITRSAIRVIANPIQTAAYGGSVPTRKPGDPFRIIYSGRLEVRKGVLDLADALVRVFAERPNCEAVFVGPDTRLPSGSVGAELRRRLAPHGDRVHLCGHVTGRAYVDMLRTGHCAVLPSTWENCPYSCLEALACGLPVIATTGSGFDEMLDYGRAGLLIAPRDTVGLAAAILAVEAEPAEASALADTGSKHVQRYDVSSVADTMEGFYCELLREECRR